MAKSKFLATEKCIYVILTELSV